MRLRLVLTFLLILALGTAVAPPDRCIRTAAEPRAALTSPVPMDDQAGDRIPADTARRET